MKITQDDITASYSLQCAILGIGSLTMGHNFGQAGLLPGLFALVSLAAVTALAQVGVSLAMQRAPEHVDTFSDLGYFVGGKKGKWIALGSQFAACLLIPIAYLVLGGATLMPVLFGDIWTPDPNVHIPLMALILWPVVLIPTLKEGRWGACVGCATAVFGITVALYDSLASSPFYGHAAPKIQLSNVVYVFGSLAMGFGSTVVIPAVQREHPRPERMPYIILTVLGFTTMCYAIIGSIGYWQFGCMAPGNLLLTMTSYPLKIFAYVNFLVHVMLAFAVYLSPALYLFERTFLGINIQTSSPTRKSQVAKNTSSSPALTLQVPKNISSSPALTLQLSKNVSSSPAFTLQVPGDDEYVLGYDLPVASFSETEMKVQRTKSICLRTFVVILQCSMAMLLQGCFNDLLAFVGSSTLTLSAFVLPIFFYARVCGATWKSTSHVFVYILCLLFILLGIYTTALYGSTIVRKATSYTLFSMGAEVDIGEDNCCAREPIIL